MNNKLTSTFLAGALTALIGACGDGSANFRIGNIIGRAGDTCTEFETSIVWGHGYFDLQGYDYYGDAALFDYQPAMEIFYEPLETGTVNSSPDVYLDGVNVTVTSLTEGIELDPALTKFASRFRAAFSGSTFFVSPVLISQALGEELDAQINAGETAELKISIKAFGSEDGDDIVSPSVDYYVTVCRGCLTANVGSCIDFDETDTSCDGWVNQSMTCCDWQGPDGATEVCPAVKQEAPTAQ